MWSEFGRDYLGISHRQLMYLLSGQRRAGKKTFDGILNLRNHGIMVHMSDFEVKTTP